MMPFSVREADLEKYNNDSDHWNEVYHGLIIPAINNSGLIAQRDDDDYSTRLLVEGIWTKIEHAEIVLCDLSSHNPNAHLELGWALRADKKIVLIKDDKTSFNFDLNQFYTFQYYSTLQPKVLKQSIEDLSKVIETTLKNDVSNYSMVAKMALNKRAINASNQGNIEVDLLKEVLDEVRLIKNQNSNLPQRNRNFSSLNIKSFSDLSTVIIGTTWRKKDGLEEIFFVSQQIFVYSSVGKQKWLENDVSFNAESDYMELRWRHDNYVSICKFDSNFSQFSEQDGVIWFLIAKEPFVHSSFKRI